LIGSLFLGGLATSIGQLLPQRLLQPFLLWRSNSRRLPSLGLFRVLFEGSSDGCRLI
jgi:hypothetical protein